MSTITQTRRPGRETGPTGKDDATQWVPVDYVGHYDPNFVTDVCAGLDALTLLEPNWDQEGAPRIRHDVLEAAKRLIKSLPNYLGYQPDVVPLPNGTVQLEWNDGPKALELEFENPNTIHYLKWHPSENIEEEECISADDVPRVVELIQWFTS